MSASASTAFRLGHREFGFLILDCRDRYDRPAVDARFSGQLDLEPSISQAAMQFGRLLRDYPGALRMYDGDRLVISAQPELTADTARPCERILRLRFRRTSYLAGAICRQLPSPQLARYLTANWPPDVPSVATVRDVVRRADGFHPLRNPGTGVSICPVATDESGRPWTALRRRSPSVAVNPGLWSTAIDESFSLADVGADGRLDPWAAARRGAREELGIELSEVSLFSFGLDPFQAPGRPPSGGCGYVFSGWARTAVAPSQLARLNSGSSDAFETDGARIVELTSAGVAGVLSGITPGQISLPAVNGLLGTLERVQPGAAEEAVSLLTNSWN